MANMKMHNIGEKLRNMAVSAMIAGGFLASGAAGAVGGIAQAAELLMLEQDGCAWCRKWHAEIGETYSKTSEGKVAPIRYVDINEPWPEDISHIRKERFTPTFVLMDEGVEIARLRGYTGDEFFWFLLDEMLQKLPEKPEVEG